MNIKIVKPQEQMTIRLDSDLSIEDIRVARSFKREALRITDEKDRILFDVDFGSTRIGPCGLRLSPVVDDKKAKIQVLIPVNAQDITEFRANVANISKHLTTVTTQIQAAVKEFSELKIEEI